MLSLTRKTCLSILFIFTATIILYYPVRTFDFVDYDDPMNIYENTFINPPTIEHLKVLWKTHYYNMYIPITYSYWGFLSSLSPKELRNGKFQISPTLFHLANLFHHLLNTALVFLLLQNLLKNRISSILGSLLFSLHPLQVEPVAWATCMRDLLSATFSLLTIFTLLKIYSIKDSTSFNRRFLIHFLTLILFTFGLLSKPITFIAPLIFIFINILNQTVTRTKLLHATLLFVLGAISMVYVKGLQSNELLAFIPSYGQRILIAWDAVSFYAMKFLWPFNLIPDYGRTPETVLQSGLSLYHLSPLLFLIPFFFLRFKNYLILLCLILIPIMPVLGLLPFEAQNISTVFDRYMYLSLFGLALLIATLHKHFSKMRNLGVIFSILILFWGLRSHSELKDWNDSKRLFNDTITHNPRSFSAHYNLGVIYLNETNLPLAKDHFYKAHLIAPNHAKVMLSLAKVSSKLSEGDDLSISLLNKIITLPQSPYTIQAHMGLGQIYLRKNDLKKSKEHFEEVIRLSPRSEKAEKYLASIYNKLIQIDS